MKLSKKPLPKLSIIYIAMAIVIISISILVTNAQVNAIEISDIEFIGEDMLQFHIQFDVEGGCGDIYSIESYFLAKKFISMN